MASKRQTTGTPSRDTERECRGAAATGQTENSPTQSPWWNAPAGRPVPIPAFGRTLLDVLMDLLMPKPLIPKPVLVPAKVRTTRRR